MTFGVSSDPSPRHPPFLATQSVSVDVKISERQTESSVGNLVQRCPRSVWIPASAVGVHGLHALFDRTCGAKALILQPFQPYGGGPPRPDLKRVLCHHSRTVETAQSIFPQTQHAAYHKLRGRFTAEESKAVPRRKYSLLNKHG